MEVAVQTKVEEELVPASLKFSMRMTTWLSVVVGLCVIIYSVYTLFSVIAPTLMVSSYLLLPAFVLMITGMLFPFFTLVGYRGSTEENMENCRKCFLAMCAFLFIAVVLSIFTCISTFSDDGSRISYPLEEAIISYHDDLSMAGRVDNLQKQFSCCGVNGPQDWNYNEHFTCDDTNRNPQRCNLPASCCRRNLTHPAAWNCARKALNDSAFLFTKREDIIQEIGCRKVIDDLLFSTTLYILFIFLFLMLCELLVWRLSLSVMTVHERNFREKINPLLNTREYLFKYYG